MKDLLVNTWLGQVGLGFREALAVHLTAFHHLEALPTMANDQIARKLLEGLCVDGGIFVDVGAHIGSVIAGVARHSRPGKIVAVEAMPDKAAVLRKRFADAEVHAVAVSDHEGSAEFIVDLARPGCSSLDPETSSRTHSSKVISVPVTLLDKIAPHQGVDLVKLDVEGAELGVLRGSESLVACSRPTIMFESGAEEMAGFTRQDLWHWFEQRDYELVLPNRVAHLAPKLSLACFLDAHEYPRATTNYFAIARERRDAVRARARSVLGLNLSS